MDPKIHVLGYQNKISTSRFLVSYSKREKFKFHYHLDYKKNPLKFYFFINLKDQMNRFLFQEKQLIYLTLILKHLNLVVQVVLFKDGLVKELYPDHFWIDHLIVGQLMVML